MSDDAKKIMGQYWMYADIDAEYTFTGADRNVSFSPTSNSLNFYLLGGSKYDAPNSAAFLKNNKIVVKKFKFTPMGAKGCRTSQNVGTNCVAIHGVNYGETLFDNVLFTATNWGEWNDCNIIIEPFKAQGSDSDPHVYFELDNAYSYFTVDDYNIQAAYVGQKMKVRLELMVDTAGVDIYHGGII